MTHAGDIKVIAVPFSVFVIGIDVSKLSSGMYFIRVNDGKAASGNTFVKL